MLIYIATNQQVLISNLSLSNRWKGTIFSDYKQKKITARDLFQNSYSTTYLIKGTISDLNKKITSNYVKSDLINPTTTLYFDKSCVFPRYKLNDSEFKRCIKPEKADYIVIPRINGFKCHDYLNPFIGQVYRFAINNIVYLCNQDVYNYIKYDKPFSEVDVEILSDSDLKYIVADSKALGTSVHNILHNYNKPFIFEDDLDKFISNKYAEILDKDQIFSIYEMMNSNDDDSVELGCKLLSNFNIFEKKLTVATLLFVTQFKWLTNKGSNSATFKNMLHSLNYYSNGYTNIESFFRNNKPASDEDLAISKLLLQPWLEEQIRKNIRLDFYNLPFKVNISVKVE